MRDTYSSAERQLTAVLKTDLLNSRQPVSILEDSFGVIQLAGAQEKFSDSVDGLLGHIQEAALSRLTESTLKNDVSSRSHSICRLRIQTPGTAAEDGLLYMIDLAGSEAARDVASHGADRMRETREINVSLSVLKDCIRGKVEANAAALAALSGPKSERTKVQKPHIPFRRSALTKVLKHVFDPNGMRTCKTVVIACINPSIVDVGASKNTLRYAEMLRVSLPKTGQESAAGDSAAPGTWSNEKLRRWIDQNVSFKSSPAPLMRSQTSNYLGTVWSPPSLVIAPGSYRDGASASPPHTP